MLGHFWSFDKEEMALNSQQETDLASKKASAD
jgi:hypothetical protein